MSEKKHLRRIDIVIGTRPEAIKMAPVIVEMKRRGNFSVRVVATGQHTDMLRQALDYFGLKADVNLDIMRQTQTLDYITSSALVRVGETFDADKPDAVLVHGDTTTTFAAALAAFYRQIPVGHVEAGLRSFDKYRPFPEEMNRVLTDRIAKWWFAPTDLARKNLLAEGVADDAIFVTGNTVVDALQMTLKKASPPQDCALSPLRGEGERFLLVTAHRRESWGKPLERICDALLDLLSMYEGWRVLVPMHKNPTVRTAIEAKLGGHSRVILCDPLDYPDFVWALDNCTLILSDSGGVQEEASALRKPVLILREITERPEALEQGSGILVGTDRDKIVAETDNLLRDEGAYARIVRRCENSPFGDGRAAGRIADILAEE